MPFGEIFIGTFVQIWRHKRLWLFGLLGTLISSIGLVVYQTLQFRWQSSWFGMMDRMTENPDILPQGFAFDLLSSMAWLWAGIGLLLLCTLLGYLVNLVMRSATMHEAATAWAGGSTQTGRGIAQGAGRAVYVFLIDLLWFVPGILLGCGGVFIFFVLLFGAGSASDSNGAAGAFVLAFLAAICGVTCLGLLVALASGIFSPLMYQSAVVGRRGLGLAVSEGWRLAQANLGAMIIFVLLMFVLGILVNIVVSILSLPLLVPWMGSFMSDLSRAAEGPSRGEPFAMPQFRSGWLVVAGLWSALLAWLGAGFMQSFRLVLYAEVYRRLTGMAAGTTAAAPAPPSAHITAPAAPPAEVVPGPAAVSPDAPSAPTEITVPEDVPPEASQEPNPHL
jgi:hypothetical protein